MMEIWEALFPNVYLEELWAATYETLYMTVVSLFFTALLGIPLGVLLYMTARGNPWENRLFYSVTGTIVNIFRSIPFIILIILLIPYVRLMFGVGYGMSAAIPALIVGAAPFYARLVEIAFREIPKGVVEAAQAMGASNRQIIFKVLLPEAKPALVSGLTVTGIALIGYTAMAGVVGAGGLGYYAYRMGFQMNYQDVTLIATVAIIIIVQLFQMVGDLIVKAIDKR
ncbi:ABC-type transporter, integral membrane subunit [Caldalkalibacillus thermarum TA2.A1]|uniref:ABC-type transporter, integral membrane subunit n=1 Tax=Caldalkalibacillus thermarum (strain TA2.A1) TaxID=986075 RepID=F5L7H8_CALTT|nr:ABC-type transporter, integral membrane subunit [Caldalkalibacillus thermarum TA2.A1]